MGLSLFIMAEKESNSRVMGPSPLFFNFEIFAENYVRKIFSF